MTCHLATYNFLIGGSGVGRTTLMSLIAEADPRSAPASFDEPLREATMQLFFPDQMMRGIDLRTAQGPLPFVGQTPTVFLSRFRDFLKIQAASIRGDLAKRRALFILDRTIDRIVYDDAEGFEDIGPFVRAFGPDACRLIFINRRGNYHPADLYLKLFSASSVPKVILTNEEGNPSSMLEQLGFLRKKPSPWVEGATPEVETPKEAL